MMIVPLYSIKVGGGMLADRIRILEGKIKRGEDNAGSDDRMRRYIANCFTVVQGLVWSLWVQVSLMASFLSLADSSLQPFTFNFGHIFGTILFDTLLGGRLP